MPSCPPRSGDVPRVPTLLSPAVPLGLACALPRSLLPVAPGSLSKGQTVTAWDVTLLFWQPHHRGLIPTPAPGCGRWWVENTGTLPVLLAAFYPTPLLPTGERCQHGGGSGGLSSGCEVPAGLSVGTVLLPNATSRLAALWWSLARRL